MIYKLLKHLTFPLAVFALSGNITAKEPLPNIIIIFTDDQGYGDIGCYGATGFETPHLDRMAAEGMRFTNFYSGSAVCTPARAALLTGCYPARVSLTKVLFPFDNTGLNSEETTIAEMLKMKGYATGIVGKWHLGHHREFLPLQHGFDEYFGLPYSNGMWPVDYDGNPIPRQQGKRQSPPLPLIEGNKKIEEISTLSDQDKLTTRYTERAVDFIHREKNHPFFLYLAHTMPHQPLGVSDKFRGKSEHGMYGDVIMEIDWSVGEIMKALKENGIEENTLVIFASDNGPAMTYGNHAGFPFALREAKGSPFEGGFRVPCIMKWPGVIEEGIICNKMAAGMDIFPTIAEITGAELPEKKIDGVSLFSVLNGSNENTPRQAFFYYSGDQLNAVRWKEWKLVFPFTKPTHVGSIPGKDGWPGKQNRVKFEGGLYDLRRDPGERYDVKNKYPAIVRKLEQMADSMRSELGDAARNTEGSEIRLPGLVSSSIRKNENR